jgi:hypothetical protein
MANRYWVGGSGTWDASSTANWSTTSGGAAGASAPVAADTALFDANSGIGTCTTAAGAVCTTVTKTSSDLGLTLGADLTITGAFTLTNGDLSLGSNTLTCKNFSSSNSNARSVGFGTGNITVTGNNLTVYNVGDGTNMTFSGTPIVNATYSGSTGTRTISGPTINPSTTNIANINVSAGSDIISFGTGVRGSIDVDFTGFTGTCTELPKLLYGSLTLSAGMTLGATTGNTIEFVATSGTKTITTAGKTIDNSITFNGVGGTWQLVDNLTTGSTRTVTLTNGTLDLNSKTLSCGIFSSSNANARTITAGASGQINLTGNNLTVINIGNPNNLTITDIPTNLNLTYSGSTGTRTITLGTPNVDLTGVFDINVTAGSDIITNTGNGRWHSADFTGFAGAWTIAGSRVTVAKDLTLSSGMTISSTSVPLEFNGTSGTGTITTNGKTIDAPISFDGIGGTWAFADALTQGSTRAFTITNGTVALKNGVTSTVGAFATSGTNQKYLQSTLAGSQATLSQASGTVSVSYLTIQDINATGGATWEAFTTNNNVDAGNNLGWDFSFQTGKYMYTVRKNKRILP